MQQLILANGERELKTYNCFYGGAGKGELILTSARLIFRSEQQYEDETSTFRYEVSINDIKSINTSSTSIQPKSSGAPKIIFGILLVIAAVIAIIQQQTYWYAIGGIVGIIGIALFIAGLTRKKATHSGALIIDLSGCDSRLIIVQYPEHVAQGRKDGAVVFSMAVTKDFENLQNEIGAIWQNAIKNN